MTAASRTLCGCRLRIGPSTSQSVAAMLGAINAVVAGRENFFPLRGKSITTYHTKSRREAAKPKELTKRKEWNKKKNSGGEGKRGVCKRKGLRSKVQAQAGEIRGNDMSRGCRRRCRRTGSSQGYVLAHRRGVSLRKPRPNGLRTDRHGTEARRAKLSLPDGRVGFAMESGRGPRQQE